MPTQLMSTWPSTQPLAPWTAMIGPICKDYSYYSMNLAALWTEMLKNKILCWFNQTQLLTKVTRLHLYNSHCICCKTHLIQIWKKNNISQLSGLCSHCSNSHLCFSHHLLSSLYISAKSQMFIVWTVERQTRMVWVSFMVFLCKLIEFSLIYH